MNTQDYQEYLELINEGHSQRSAAKILGIDRCKVQRYIKKQISEDVELKHVTRNEFFEFSKEGLSKFGKTISDSIEGHVKDQIKSTLHQSLEKYQNTDHGAEFENFDLFEDKPKVLFYDIETSLAKSYHFQQWKVNLSQKQKIQESHLLSHAWAWNDGEVKGSILTRDEMLSHDPERLVLECWSLLDNCDILVAHNGKRFDVKKVNSYFLQYGMPPPSPYRVIDTLLIAKQKFALPFNSLAYLAEFLNVDQKIDTGGVDLWIDCDKGKQEALDKMLEYNIGDIITLRGVYNHLISWSNDGVNMALYNDHGASCPHCASDKVKIIQGKYAHTIARKYQVYRCEDCGAVLRSNRMEGKGNSLVRVVN